MHTHQLWLSQIQQLGFPVHWLQAHCELVLADRPAGPHTETQCPPAAQKTLLHCGNWLPQLPTECSFRLYCPRGYRRTQWSFEGLRGMCVVVMGGQRVSHIQTHAQTHTHTNTSINTLTRTHWVPLMMIIRAFRGCPWGQAGDWGVIFTLKRPMIGSDCDNDHHYCHYSVKWLREKENFKKVDWGFLYLFFVLWLGWVLRRKEYETSRLLSLLYINHNSTISKDTKLVRWGQWGTEKWSVIFGCSKS